MATDDARRPSRPILAGLVGGGGGMRRIFVDHVGISVPMPAAVRRLVATDDDVGALVLRLGGALVGCAGSLDGVESVGPARAPDPRAVAALKPDIILAGVADGTHDLVEERLAITLWQVAPIIAVDLGRPSMAEADLRALIGSQAKR